MRRLHRLGLGFLAGASLALTACGGDDTSSATEAASSTSGTGGAATSSSTTSGPGPTSSSTSAATGSGGAGGEGGATAPPPWHDDPPTLSIAACVERNMSVVPNPGNEGHLAEVRLTPPSYPFQITGIEYELFHGMTNDGGICDATLAHRVEIYVDTAVTPSNTPTIAAQLDLPAAAVPAEATRLVKEALTMPITL